MVPPYDYFCGGIYVTAPFHSFLILSLDFHSYPCTSSIKTGMPKYDSKTRKVRKLNLHLKQQLTDMLHQMNRAVRSSKPRRKWALGDQGHARYHMLLHVDRRLIIEHARTL